MDHDEIDHLLGSLGQPSTVGRRLEILERIIGYWHGPLDPGRRLLDDAPRGVRLPRALRWLYPRCADHPQILGRFNRLLGPDDLVLEDGRLLFYVENQGVYLWATEGDRRDRPEQLRFPWDGAHGSRSPEDEGEDARVWGRFNEEDEPWDLEEVLLSEFLIQACLFEAIMPAEHGASASWANQALLDRVTAPLKPVPLGAWKWPSYPHRFWAGGGVFVSACPNGEGDGEVGYTIMVGSKAEGPLRYLKAIVDESWEHKTF